MLMMLHLSCAARKLDAMREMMEGMRVLDCDESASGMLEAVRQRPLKRMIKY